MHHLIRFVVEADSKEDALKEAESQLNDLIEAREGYIDYGSFFDDGVVGAGHSVRNWGCDKAAYKLEEEKGRELVMQGLMFGYTDFLDQLEEAKKILNEKTTKEIYEDSMLSWRIRRVGKEEWVVFESEFVNVIGLGHDLQNKESKDLWVVPCDVHT